MSSSLKSIDARRVVQLRQAGQSLRSIGQRFAVAPATVHKRLQEIGDGLRCDECRPEEPLPDDDRPPGYEPANIRRCRGCGALVYLWPCLACCLAEETAEVSSKANSASDDQEHLPC